MTKRMLIDAAHPEETRVVVLDGTPRSTTSTSRASTKRQLKGNIYLAKVTRVEPSLQAAFVEYGGNRHGFLAFNEIHPDYYQIPQADREALSAMRREDDETAIRRANGHRAEGDGDGRDARRRRRRRRRSWTSRPSAAAAGCCAATRSRKSSSAGRSCWCRSSRKSAATRARR